MRYGWERSGHGKCSVNTTFASLSSTHFPGSLPIGPEQGLEHWPDLAALLKEQ